MTHRTRYDQRIQAILASGIKIPPMPEVLAAFEHAAARRRCRSGELAALIRDDGALSGAVFRVGRIAGVRSARQGRFSAARD
jgi:HD-like signal output (HDOD) protein